MPALRLLPVVIVAAVCMLGLRIEVVVQTIANARRASLQVSSTTALAQAQPAPAAQTAAPAASGSAAAPASGAPAAAPGAPGAEKAAEPTPSDPPKAEAEAGGPSGFNPANLTKAEIETLQRLAERREQIEKREQELNTREAVLKAGEERIDGKVAQLQDLEKSIKGLLSQYDKQKQAEIEQLVRIYTAMKPKDAANIFNTLDMPILVAVVQSMKEAKVAPIMAVMSPEKARLLTEELSQRKQIGQATN